MKAAVYLVALLCLASCATPYQEYPEGRCSGFGGQCGGVSITYLGDDVYRIHVEVTNAYDDLALQYFERKRLELEKQHGSCETLYVVARNNPTTLLDGVRGAFADGRVRCPVRKE